MTSTITARLDLPRGRVEVHTEGTAAECYAVLAGLDIVAQALGIDVDTERAPVVDAAPVVEMAPVDERPVTYTVDPPKAKRKTGRPGGANDQVVLDALVRGTPAAQPIGLSTLPREGRRSFDPDAARQAAAGAL